jgi:molybdate transport system substrate-binding protein
MHSRSVLRRGFVAGLFVTAVAGFGCQRSESEPKPSAERRELSVFAASSLRDAFTELAPEFEHAHARVHVMFNFAGTQELRTQLEHGARADVFASADLKHANALLESKRILAPVSFARNEPVVVVPSGPQPGLRAFGDLPSVTKIVIGAPEVPIGRYTLQILDRASQQLGADFRSRVETKVVSRELNVRQVLAKISLGEADAAIVYRTDANAAREKVRLVAIPAELNVIAEYPIAVVADAPEPELAVEWVNLVRSEVGRKVLVAAGFLAPETPAQPK